MQPWKAIITILIKLLRLRDKRDIKYFKDALFFYWPHFKTYILLSYIKVCIGILFYLET